LLEVCPNGHIRTEENTRYHKYGNGDKVKRRCADCKKRVPTGRPTVYERSAQRTTELHEDIEDLINYGATFEEIVQRSGYVSWERMRNSLTKRGRFDVLEKLRLKRGDVYQTQLHGSVIPGTPSSAKTFSASERGQWIMENL
jgi:hypothetical protein